MRTESTPIRQRILAIALVGISLAWIMAFSGCSTDQRLIIEIEQQSAQPWTHLELNNAAENFQFAIVADRTGGLRPGVFGEAVQKLNLLQPEFVMSIGDLIQGGTEDLKQLEIEWDEFEGLVAGLEMPFFYLPGNHDISNTVMEKVWAERFGRTYYHFVYHDVLFLCLNTEDPPPTNLSDAQIDYFKGVLAENTDVRWTLVFLHKPLWARSEDSGWPRVEELLQGRDYTVFAGHTHKYVKYERFDQRYIVLATTGGSSRLRGRSFGEFDHVMWVTMTAEGPVLANLMLDGIWDEDVRTEDVAVLVKKVTDGRAVRFEPNPTATSPRLLKVRLTNDADLPARLTLRFPAQHGVTVAPESVEQTISPNSFEFVEFAITPGGAGAPIEAEKLQLEYALVYDLDGESVEVRGTASPKRAP